MQEEVKKDSGDKKKKPSGVGYGGGPKGVGYGGALGEDYYGKKKPE
jgi:hypothetical protein